MRTVTALLEVLKSIEDRLGAPAAPERIAWSLGAAHGALWAISKMEDATPRALRWLLRRLSLEAVVFMDTQVADLEKQVDAWQRRHPLRRR